MGKSIICEPLKLNVFRVPTDNDKTHSADWDNMGLRNLKVKAGHMGCERVCVQKFG